MRGLAERTVSLDDLLDVSGLADSDTEVLTSCRHVVESGGKRFRPRLVFASSELGPVRDDPSLRKAAVSVELFHCATLVHDDVIDDAPTRRSRLTVARQFGSDNAALAGGWLFGAAARLACECGDGSARLFVQASNRICEGQMLELSDLFDGRRSVERYFEAITGKTAALFSLSTALGAELAGAHEATVERAAAFGLHLGIAYQLLDDVLDFVSGPAADKSRLQDLRMGVYTLPVLYAIEQDAEIGELLRADARRDGIEPLARAIRATDGLERTVEDARTHAQTARQTLAELEGREHVERLLEQMVGSALERQPR